MYQYFVCILFGVRIMSVFVCSEGNYEVKTSVMRMFSPLVYCFGPNALAYFILQ